MVSLDIYQQSAQLIQKGKKVLASCTTVDQRSVAMKYWMCILAWHQRKNLQVLNANLPNDLAVEDVQTPLRSAPTKSFEILSS